MKISINGSTKITNESIMRGIVHEEILYNIRTILAMRNRIRKHDINRPSITFQVIYMRSNVQELPELLRLAIDLGIDRFKGHHLWVTWPEVESESLTKDRKSRKLWNQTVFQLKEIASTTHSPDGNNIKLDNLHLLELESDEKHPSGWMCPFLGKEAWIAWDGTFNVCCSPDDKRKTLGEFGNVLETDFMKLWESDKYETHKRIWGNHKVCMECNMRKPQGDLCK